jgi:hypothetical protein
METNVEGSAPVRTKAGRKPGDELGRIYFLWVPEQSAIKIGFTTDFDKRLSRLQTGNPNTLEVLEVFRGTRGLEQRLHQKFNPYRLAREWFQDAEALFLFLEELEDLRREFYVAALQAGEVEPDLDQAPEDFDEIVVPENRVLALSPAVRCLS